MSSSQFTIPILRAKLFRPPVTPDYINRSVQDTCIEAGFQLPLTVISAPAGYGKSTLVSHWLELSDYPYAWLSLDDSDSDVRVFLAYVVAALRTVYPKVCGEILNIINAENLPPLPVIAALLSNELDELDERVILVLDDYHRIREPGIHLLLDKLLEHPHRYLHLVILSRRDPLLSLATFRAHHSLTELRMQDLQFTKEETLSFISQAINQPVEQDIIERLQSSTEGWPAGIRLAALGLQHQNDVEKFISQFGVNESPLHEFLVGEVLSGQPLQVQDCLLKISILERFNASLGEAVFNTEGSNKNNAVNGREFINTLQNSGLFCVALDGQGNWFRFHHLFGELLQQQLDDRFSREEISYLHQRASNWYAKNDYFEEAIHHALAAGDNQGAAEIVGQARHQLMITDQWHRLERWLNVFSQQVIQQQPQLMVLRCWLDLSHWYRLDMLGHDLDQVDALLEHLTLNALELDRLKIETSVIRSSLAYWLINPMLVLSLTEQALNNTSDEQEYVNSVALMYRMGAHQFLGEIHQVERLYKNYLEEEQFKSPGSQARILQALCFIYWSEGSTRKLQQFADRLLGISLEHKLSWSHSFARYFLGLIHYERNELSAAVTQLSIIVDEPYRYPIQNVTHCSFLLSLTYQAMGLSDRAREVANAINKHTVEHGNKAFIDLAEAFQAELDLRQGRIAPADHWARNFASPAPHCLHRFYNAEFTFIKTAMSRQMPRELTMAAGQLELLENAMNRSNHQRLKIDLLGMKAILADAQGNSETALALLQEAVLLGQPGLLIRPLADLGANIVSLLNRLDLDHEGLRYVGMILSAFKGTEEAAKVPAKQLTMLESLSQREIEILGLFSKDLSNKEIAEQLFISTGTVKRHAHNIYSKLAVNSRQKAVAKAAGLGILINS